MTLPFQAVTSLLELLMTFALVTAAFLVIGIAVRIVIARFQELPPGMGVTLGIGAGFASLLVAYAHWLGIPVRFMGLSVLVVSILVLSTKTMRETRKSSFKTAIHGLSKYSGVQAVDLIVICLVLGVFFGVLVHGVTVWTFWANDFSWHVAYLQSWTNETVSGDPFLDVHAGRLGEFMASRADYERPAGLAYLGLVTVFSGKSAISVLAASQLLPVMVAVSAMTTTIRLTWKYSWLKSVLLAAIPMLGVVPVARVLDGQVGHAAAAMFIATAFAVVAGSANSDEPKARISAAIIVGTLLTAAVASNPMLVMSLLIPVVLTLTWIYLRLNHGRRSHQWSLLFISAISMVVTSLPFIGRYLETWQVYSSGVYGYDLPLPLPLAVFGLQPALFLYWSSSLLVLVWVLFLSFVMIGIWNQKAPLLDRLVGLGAVTSVALTATILVVRSGALDYTTHKFVSLSLFLFSPFLLAGLVSAVRRHSRLVTTALVATMSVSFVVSLISTSQVSIVVQRELLDLSENSALMDLEGLDIDLGNEYDDLVAALVVPVPKVQIVDFEQGEGSVWDPMEWTLIRSSNVVANQECLTKSVSASFSIVKSSCFASRNWVE